MEECYDASVGTAEIVALRKLLELSAPATRYVSYASLQPQNWREIIPFREWKARKERPDKNDFALLYVVKRNLEYGIASAVCVIVETREKQSVRTALAKGSVAYRNYMEILRRAFESRGGIDAVQTLHRTIPGKRPVLKKLQVVNVGAKSPFNFAATGEVLGILEDAQETLRNWKRYESDDSF